MTGAYVAKKAALLEDRYDFAAYSPGLARGGGARYLLLAESPTGYVPWAPEIHAELKGSARVAAVFDPYARAAAPVYDPHDAFFVPVAGFDGVLQPGPRITIYELAPPR